MTLKFTLLNKYMVLVTVIIFIFISEFKKTVDFLHLQLLKYHDASDLKNLNFQQSVKLL